MPHKNLDDRRRTQALWRRQKSENARHLIIESLGGSCSVCGFSDARALNIDHVNGGGNQERLIFGGSYYDRLLERVKAGSTDYQLLCANCNQIKVHEQREGNKRKHDAG